MSLFFIIFFTLYGAIHLYAFLKARAALHFRAGTGAAFAVFMIIMTLAPVIVRYLERYELESIARLMSYIGYIWMGVLFLFFSLSLCIDAYRLLLLIIRRITDSGLSAVSLSARASFFIPLIYAVAAGGYGFFEARDIKVDHLRISTPKISEELSGLTITQVSDVHVGLIVREDRLKRIIEKVKETGPDILVSTGDLVDGQINRLNGLAEMWQGIQPRYGKYAITGNHEYYAGIDQSLDFTRKAGFTLLRGEAIHVPGVISIAGVDDPAGIGFGRYRNGHEKELLSSMDQSEFILLLKHRPLVDPDAAGLFDLQISGHTHKGQIFPFSLITKFYYPRHAGYLTLPNNSHLRVSRGTGTWGPPIRFLSPPEVTVIELVHSDDSMTEAKP